MAKRRRFTAGYEAQVALEARWQDKTELKIRRLLAVETE